MSTIRKFSRQPYGLLDLHQDELPAGVAEVSAYGYRSGGGPGAYVPLTGREPDSTTAPSNRDVAGSAFAASGQPVGPELWRHVIGLSETAEGRKMLQRLLQLDETGARTFTYEGVIGLQTDANGNGVAKFFDVPSGARAFLTRAVVEVGGMPPGSAVNAAAWLGIFETGGGTSVQNVTTATYQPGQLRAFAPQNSAAGLFLPCLIVDDGAQAWGFRAGTSAAVVLAGIAGLANKGATIAYRFNVVFDQVSPATD